MVFCPLTPFQEDVYQTLLQNPDVEMIRKKNFPCDCGSGEDRGKCCYTVGIHWNSPTSFPGSLIYKRLPRQLEEIVPCDGRCMWSDRVSWVAVVNARLCETSKCFKCELETLRLLDVQTSFLNTNKQIGTFETFVALENNETRPWQLFENNWNRETQITPKKTETARLVKFDENFARPMVFKEPFVTSNFVPPQRLSSRKSLVFGD